MMYTYTFILFEMLATIVVFLISLDNKFKRIYEQLQLNYIHCIFHFFVESRVSVFASGITTAAGLVNQLRQPYSPPGRGGGGEYFLPLPPSLTEDLFQKFYWFFEKFRNFNDF